MDIEKFKNSKTGRILKTDRGFWTFVPNKLPPQIEYNKEIVLLLSGADRQLGNLAGVGALLPNPTLLITPYIKKESVLSSKIEGTQTSLSELFYFEASNRTEQQNSDVLEVVNYVKALSYGINRLSELPLSLRLIKEMHQELMFKVIGEHSTPGEFRHSQNWIGPPSCTLNEAIYVPPPVNEMTDLLSDFENFLHDRETFPGLIQCAIMHYQFESIHPFLDGNGRIGRLLITLFLCERKYLEYPILYLSAYFNKYRDEYYNRLLAVSENSDWDGWIKFFLKAVEIQSKNAYDNSKSILELLNKYRSIVKQNRGSAYVLQLVDELFLNPFVTIPYVAKKLVTTYPTAKSAIEKLKSENILIEYNDKRRGKVYYAHELLKLLE